MADPNHCCAVGESYDDGSTEDGGRIYCTFDGTTWTRTFWSPETTKEAFSLMEIRFASSTEIWAVGGELGAAAPSAWFLHSIDGGKTWVNNQPPIFGSMGVSIDMIGTTVGCVVSVPPGLSCRCFNCVFCSYASLDNTVLQQASVAKYTSN
jgi:hypothetical protein